MCLCHELLKIKANWQSWIADGKVVLSQAKISIGEAN
jgi:hypothetical protein